MLVLFETPAGYAFFKLLDEKRLSKADDLYNAFQNPKEANKILKLKHFEKFADTTDALEATTAAIEGKLGKPLKRALKKVIDKEVQQQILLADAKVGNVIKEKFNVNCVTNTNVSELIRCIRAQTESLLSGLESKELTAMALGLAHSLSRYKLKFSPDKVDTMIIQAISLLDDLDKELNNYVMRCREWYGWHFPELGKILTDNTTYVKTVKLLGTRDNANSTDLSDILPEDVEERVKEMADVSMGTEIAEDDIINIQYLCDQVIEISNYRTQLYEYLKARMTAIAPNVTIMLGELVGARLISHAGSLINLAKQPASTIQIFGAEKALFRALKSNKETPKFGLIYHSSIVSGAASKLKGKISRTLAAKVALATRVDALGDSEDGNLSLGMEHRAKVESRLRHLEEGNLRSFSGSAKAKAKFEKYHSKSEIVHYGDAQDSTITPGKRKRDQKPLIEDITPSTSSESPLKKKFKTEPIDIKEESEDDETPQNSEKKKKKKKKDRAEESFSADLEPKLEPEEESPEKMKKKKKKDRAEESFSADLEPKLEPKEEPDEESPEMMKKKKKKKKHSMQE